MISTLSLLQDIAKHQTIPSPPPIPTSRCSCCKQIKPREEFYTDSRRDSRSSQCKSCNITRVKKARLTKLAKSKESGDA